MKPRHRRDAPPGLVNEKSAVGELEIALRRLSRRLPPTGELRDLLDACWAAWLDTVRHQTDIEADLLEYRNRSYYDHTVQDDDALAAVPPPGRA